MEIKRDRYLKELISYMCDGQVKVITGIRRCGKSYLLRNLFRKHLYGQGVKDEQILSFELDLAKFIKYRNPLLLAEHVRNPVESKSEQFYLFVDEIRMSDEVPNPYNTNGKKSPFTMLLMICVPFQILIFMLSAATQNAFKQYFNRVPRSQ